MEKTRLLTIAVIGLLILNMGLLGFMWFGRKPMPPHLEGKFEGRPPAAQFLIKELNLDEKQKAEYDIMRISHKSTRDSLNDVLKQHRETFFKGLSTGDTSEIEKIATVQKEMDLSTFHHFQALRSICSPEQQKKFDVVIAEALKILGSPKGHNPPPMHPPH